MNYIVSKIINIYNRIKGAFPTALPNGLTEFNEWADSIHQVYNLPMDQRSVRFALCSLVMRLGQSEAYKSKRYFALCLHKGAASQVAVYVMEEIKNEQKAAAEAAAAQAAAQQQAATPTEATQPESPASDVAKTQS